MIPALQALTTLEKIQKQAATTLTNVDLLLDRMEGLEQRVTDVEKRISSRKRSPCNFREKPSKTIHSLR
jgi:hypothetical protein